VKHGGEAGGMPLIHEVETDFDPIPHVGPGGIPTIYIALAYDTDEDVIAVEAVARWKCSISCMNIVHHIAQCNSCGRKPRNTKG
jgi:hypothetical protein